MDRVIGAVVLVAIFSLASPALAQFGPPRMDEDTPVVQELLVRAYGGPPWWKVSDKDTTIYVLAAPSALPADLTFDQTLLEKRLTGANEVILGPTVKIGASAIVALPGVSRLVNDVSTNTKTTLEPSLPADVRARFVAARTKAGQPETRYGGLPAGLAGMALAGDIAHARAGASPPVAAQSIDQIVTAAARRKRVRVVNAKTYGGGTMRSFLADLRMPGLPCLVSALDSIETPRRSVMEDAQQWTPIVRAWAEGDVRPLLTAARTDGRQGVANVSLQTPKGAIFVRIDTDACTRAMPTVSAIADRWAADQVDAIVRALKTKGHAVAVVDAGSLLVKGGVLDRLRQQGFTVTTPDVE